MVIRKKESKWAKWKRILRRKKLVRKYVDNNTSKIDNT